MSTKETVCEHPIDILKCPKNQPAKIFYTDGTLIVETADETMFNYVRAEIKEHQIRGCYIEYKGQKIRIDSVTFYKLQSVV